jgi:hypothetical protein
VQPIASLLALAAGLLADQTAIVRPTSSAAPLATVEQGADTDSTAFDPTGYYFPVQPIVVARSKVAWIALMPGFYELNVASDTANSGRDYSCAVLSLTRDSLDLRCPSTPLGLVRVHGAFVDRGGSFWNREDITPQETVVLRATVTAERGGRQVLARHVDFTYWVGD